jgi:hypothetical protein
MAKGMLGRRWIVLLGLALAGCGGGGGQTGSGTEDPEIRFINAAVDVPALDFRVNDRTEAAAVPYGMGNENGFRRFSAETYDVLIRPTGATEDAWAETLQAAPDGDYIVAAFGLRDFGDEFFKRLRTTQLEVNRTPPNGNKARLVVLNAFNRMTGAENVPVDFKNPGENPQYQLTGIGFGTTGTIEVDSGSQTFDVRLSGAEQVYVSETLQLEPGKIYFVILGGIEEGAGPQAPDIKLVEIATERD